MQLKLFTDLIEAFGKVTGSFKAIVNLLETEREISRWALNEIYRLIDTTLNMVIIRLGDIQPHGSEGDLLREAGLLDNHNEWMQSEPGIGHLAVGTLAPSAEVSMP
jgi:hypothetical protein